MSQGFFDKDLREWKRVRSLGWIIQCGYADPEKMPENQMVWWPLEGDSIPKKERFKITPAERKRIAERIQKEIGR